MYYIDNLSIYGLGRFKMKQFFSLHCSVVRKGRCISYLHCYMDVTRPIRRAVVQERDLGTYHVSPAILSLSPHLRPQGSGST